MRNMLLSYQQIRDAIEKAHSEKKPALAFLPVGCIEQHGPFLPLETDSIIAEELSHDICGVIRDSISFAYVYSTIHYSPTRSNMGFCGTASVTEVAFRSYVEDVIVSILKSGFDASVVVCGHGPAEPSLKEIAFRKVDEQFREDRASVKPVVILSPARLTPEIEKHLGWKGGRHADWRELMFLYHILGQSFFDKGKMSEIENFRNENTFEIHNSSIPGIPLEYRSTMGVVGLPIPDNINDIEPASEELWSFTVNSLAEELMRDLVDFIRICQVNNK